MIAKARVWAITVLALKDDLLDPIKSINIIEFVLSLRGKIRTSVEIGNEMEEKAKNNGKFWYDRKTQDMSYEVSEHDLV